MLSETGMRKLNVALTKLTPAELGKVRALVGAFSLLHRQGYDTRLVKPKAERKAKRKAKR